MPTPEPKRRWLRLSPDRFVILLLLGVCLLWLSDRFQWFGFNQHKGWTVLMALGAVGAAALVMLLWSAAALIFAQRFQFGIRSLLAFCLASAIAVSWLAVEIKQAGRQAEVIDWINISGGWVQYDWELDASGSVMWNPEPPWPEWPRNLLGMDFFSAVKQSELNGTSITDSGLEHLTMLSQLLFLDLSNTKVTDAGVRKLQQAMPNCKINH